MTNKIRNLGYGKVKLPVLATVAFAAACSREPLAEPRYDMAQPADMASDLKNCLPSCTQYSLGGRVGTETFTLNDPKTGIIYIATLNQSQKDGVETFQVSFTPVLPPEIAKNRFQDQQGWVVLSMNVDSSTMTFGVASGFGFLKVGDKLKTDKYEVELTGTQKHNDKTFAILNFSQNGNVVKSEALQNYQSLDILDGCNYSRFHAFDVHAAIVARDSYIELYSLFARVEITKDKNLIINGKVQNSVITDVQTTAQGISGYTLTYRIGSSTEFCN